MPRLRFPSLTAIIIFLAGFCSALLFMHFLPIETGLVRESGVRLASNWKYVSPLLLCPSIEEKDFGPYKELEAKLQGIINDKKKSGAAESVSVYFRGTNGQWVGINDNVPYAPASLMKVPLMIAYLKLSETEPGLLSSKLYYDGSVDLNSSETFKPTHPLAPGNHTIDEYLRAMIVDSDNNATNVLYQNIADPLIYEVFTDLGLAVPAITDATKADVTAKEYSYFLRILYNATYLSAANSEKALALMAEAKFPDGIQSAVPEGIAVADKFGERTEYDQSGKVIERELHDCGIVYGTKHRFTLCIMTKGKDYSALAGTIQAIAKTAYDNAESQ